MRKLDYVSMTTAEPADGLPDDPRARQVLRQLREMPRRRGLLGTSESLLDRMLALGFRPLLPEATPSGLWAALSRDARR